ncbi:uncharacterized protein LOC115214294 isoform X1 [Argonauta hians]
MDIKKNFDCFISSANMDLRSTSQQTPNHKSYPAWNDVLPKEEPSCKPDNLFHEEIQARSYETNIIGIKDNLVYLDSGSDHLSSQDGISIQRNDKNTYPQLKDGDVFAMKETNCVVTTAKTKPIDIYCEEESYCVDSDVPLLSSSVESDSSLNPLDISNVYSNQNKSDSDVSLLSMSTDEESESGQYNSCDATYIPASHNLNTFTNTATLNHLPKDQYQSYACEDVFIVPEVKQLPDELMLNQTEAVMAKCYSEFSEKSEAASIQSMNEFNNLTENDFIPPDIKTPIGEIINLCSPAELTGINTVIHHSNNNIHDMAYNNIDNSLVDNRQQCSLIEDINSNSQSIVIDNVTETQQPQTCIEEFPVYNTSQLNGNGQHLYEEPIAGCVTLEKQNSCDSTLPLIESDCLDTRKFNIIEIEPSFSKEKPSPLLHLLGSSNLISNSHCTSQEHVNLSDACIYMLNNLNNSYSNISLMHISSLNNIQKTCNDNMSIISAETLKTANHWKNLIAYSIGFMVMYMAFGSLRHLQSSINNSNGVGLITLSCLFAFFVIGSLFASYIVKQLEPRRATLVTVLFHILYVISNCYPTIYILLPSSAMLGFWNAVSWGAQGVYIQQLACDYAIKKGQKTEHVCSKFHGLFYLILFFSEVFGNLISSLILSSNTAVSPLPQNNLTDFLNNSTIEINTNFTNSNLQCGIHFSHLQKAKETGAPISQNTIFLLTAIFAVLDVLAFAIIFFFVDPLPMSYKNSLLQTTRNYEKLWRDIKSVLVFMKNWQFLLLVPIYLFSAMHLACISAEITKAFATCMLGVHMVGYLMICYGISDALSSYISGWLNQIVGRIMLITIGSLCFQLVILSLFLWQPVGDSLLPYILIFGFWGLSDGFYASQLCSLTGMLFPDQSEEAFSAFRMMQGVGLTLAYAYASILPLDIKMYILSGIGIIGWILYMVLEYCLRKNESTKSTEISIQPVSA